MPTRDERDFHDEIEAHLAIEVDRLVAEGLSPEAARDKARRAFGNVLSTQERFHEASRWVWFEQFRQDVRYAWRGLWRSPSFVATTVATLAVALSLVTVAFAVFNAYVLKPFAVRDPYSLYQLGWQTVDEGARRFTWAGYQEIRGRQELFDAVIGEAAPMLSWDGRLINASLVTGNYFETLGARMLMGRPIGDLDTRAPGGDPVAVLRHEAWKRLFDSDPGILGRAIDLNGHRFVIVGVTRPEFLGLGDTPPDLWAPITMHPTLTGEGLFDPRARDGRMMVTARVRHDVSEDHARSALGPVMTRICESVRGRAGTNTATPAVRVRMESQATPVPLSLELIAILSPIFGAFLLVLVAACANVSNVMLARANARHREIAVRLSIGASRSRVVRQLLTEGLLIALLAAGAGLVLASLTLQAGLAAFFAMLPPSIVPLARVLPLEFDYRVFFFSLAAAAATTLLFALLPALQATRVSLTDALRGEAGAFRGRRVRSSTLRQILVVSQVAVSLLLLVPAATLVRNGRALAVTDLGFDTRGVISINHRLDDDKLIAPAARALQTDPSVEEIAVTSVNPLFERMRRIAVSPEATGTTAGAIAGTRDAAATTTTRYTFVSPEYFSVLRIPVVRGRVFSAAEAQAEAGVAIVSAATAKTFWPGANAIGQTIQVLRSDTPGIDNLPTHSTVTVIGIVEDVVSGMIFDGQDVTHVYLPTSPTGAHASALLARGRSLHDGRVDSIRTALRTVHVDPFAFQPLPLSELLAMQLFPVRVSSWIGSVLGAIALILSVSGLYGVLTYTLSRRTREIGIRMALGATASGVVRLVMRQSAWLAGIGAAIGLVLAFAAMRGLSAVVHLSNVTLIDGGAFAAGTVCAIVAAAVAAWYPARRATRVDPSTTLRADA